jgi:hypothetical protein
MSRVALYSAEDGLKRDPRSPTRDEVRAQVRAILSSPAFLGSKRCCSFLEYVCERSMAGEEGALKERVIAAEVYGRQLDSVGHGDDTIVRVGAREVRKRLAQYYVTPEGAAAELLIDLPPGSYVPEFRYASPLADSVPETNIPAIPVLAPVPPAPVSENGIVHSAWSRARRILLGAICLAAIVFLGFAFANRAWLQPRHTAFERFWQPVLQSPAPLLIGVGHPIVYQPSNRVSRLSAMREPPRPFPMQEKLNLAPNEVNGADMIPVMNQYVGFGDMIAATGVSQMLAARSQNVRIMLASSIPFADLRQSPVYLIGSLTNQWTMQLSQNWRYQFAWTSDHVPVIRDTWSGTSRQWSISTLGDGTTSEDYAMICRVRSSPTGAILMIAAGIKQFGTEAAGRVLATPAELSAILAKVPAGWAERNVQIVLRMKVIGNTPAEPAVIASYVW